MRLGNVVDGGESQGNKQGMGRNKNKRSSLDFKVSSYQSNGSPITTKPGKRKNRQQQQQQQQQYEEDQQKQQQQQQQTRRPYLSRARGHSGPPPRKWELSDLQHMNEEELLQALYADPELAQEAARMAEKIAAEKGGSPSAVPTATPSRRPTTTPRGRRGYAAGRNGPGEYPDHVKELMDGGVPVLQWLILLVLLGAAFFQLRKILSLPDTNNHRDPSKRRSRAKGEPKNGAKKSKASSNLASLEKVALAIDADLQALDNFKGGKSKAVVNKKAPAVASKKQKGKNEKANTKNNPTTTKAVTKKKEDPADDNSVGSDDADLPVPASAAAKVAPSGRLAVTAPLLPTLTASARMTDQDDDVDNGWQTVSKTTRGLAEPAAAVPVEAKSSAPQVGLPTASPPSILESKENTPSPPPTTTTSLNGKNDPSAKAKKKPKNGKGKGVDNNGTTDPSTSTSALVKNGMEDDAAFAQELQREEDKIAQNKTSKINKNNNTSNMDNTWEEVSTRKRKGSKSDAATN